MAGLALMISMVPMTRVNATGADTLEDHLQGWYNFDQGTLDISQRRVENLASTGDTFNGVLGSLAAADRTGITQGTGISGASIHFEGQQAENYMRISQIINSAKSYTISLWVKFAADSPTSNTSINVVQQTGNGRSVLLAKNKTLGTYVGGADLLAQKTVDYGAWNHIVVTGENTSGTENGFRVYLNGEAVIDQDIAVSSLVDAVTDLQFGCHKNRNTGYSFTGDMDSIRIYDKAADESLVQALFAEHGGALVYEQLQSTLTKARGLLEEEALDESTQQAQELQAAVEAAGALTQESAFEEIQGAITRLTAAIQAYEEAVGKLPVSIQIMPQEIVRQIPAYMFGVNHRYHMDGYGSWDTENDQLYPEFQALCDSGNFGSIRYPGGIVSNLFDWKRSIGDTRETTIHGNWDEPAITPNFGVDEAAQYIIDEMGGEMIYVYNFGNGSAQDAADLVEYLNCEVGENPNGGIDWAAVRAENGHPQPYGVAQFEIGNEVDEGRGYWMQNDPNSWSGNGDNYAKMYAEGAVRTFTKEKVAEFDNWNTTGDKTKASHYSDGTANQVKYMRYANDVTQHEDKSKMVQPASVHVYVDNQEWTIVEDLDAAGQENVVQVNCENGEIRFGDGTHGNIPASGSDIRVTYTVEKDGIADYYDAMKAVDPDIKIYSGFSSPNIARVIHDSAEAGAEGGKFDGIAVHPYSRTNGQINDSDPQFYEKILAAVDSSVLPQINSRKAELDKYWPDGSKNVCISEYGIFNHSGDVVQSQTHAVYIAENLMEFVNLGVAYTNKHCLIDFPAGDVLGPGKQALILATKNSDGTYDYYGTPSLEVLKLFNTMSGTQVVASEITRNTQFYQGVESINSLVTKDEQGNLYVIAINAERDKEKAISIQVDGMSLAGKTIQGMKLESEDVYSVNSLNDPDNVKAQDFTLTCQDKTLEYTMQPHSVVAFRISADQEQTADKTLLQKTYDYAKDLSTDGVTDTAKAAFEKALSEAKVVLDNPNATQTEVNDAWDALLEGIWGLGLTQGDKTTLEQLIAKAEDMVANADKYVDTHWNELVDALANAKAVMDDGDAMDEDVQPVAQALLDAILAQRFKADKSILEGLISKAEGMNLEGYTAQSVAAFRSALASAQTVLADNSLSEDDQNVVDQAVAQLTAAMDGLTAGGAPETTDQPEVSQNPEETQKPQATENPQATQKPEGVPQTGDASQLGMVFSTLVLSAAGLAAVVTARKRRS